MESVPEPSKSNPSSSGAQRAEPDLTGRLLGDYQILRRLGRGGMADVYLAEQLSLRRQVAMKVLWQSLATDDAYVQRFRREAQAVAALVHANIVQIFEVGVVDGFHYLAQEYVAGTNLRHHLIRFGPLDADEATGILLQVAAALQKAAEQGIVHRDIKPENILLGRSGEAKVADFGLARVRDGVERVELTQAGKTLGTPLYMSPEQIEGGPLDPRSDLYSLGATAYQMLAGRPPFEGETALAVAVQHLQNEPPQLTELRPDLPPLLCGIVHQLLAKAPDDRVQSALELRAELTTISAAETSVQSVQTTLATNVPRRPPQVSSAPVSRRNWLKVAGAAAMLAFAFVAGCWLALVRRPRIPDLEGFTPPVTPRQANARTQFEFALRDGSERALRSVSEYFPASESPENELYGYKSILHLAYLLEETDRFSEALEYYALLAEQNSDRQLQAIGLIGQANLLVAQGSRAAANRKLFQLVRLLNRGAAAPARERQEWLRRLTPGLRSDFQRALSEANRGSPRAAGRGRSE